MFCEWQNIEQWTGIKFYIGERKTTETKRFVKMKICLFYMGNGNVRHCTCSDAWRSMNSQKDVLSHSY